MEKMSVTEEMYQIAIISDSWYNWGLYKYAYRNNL